MPKCTPKLIYMEYTTWCAFEKAMNGRWCSKLIMAIVNVLWCPLALPMHLLSFNIWWMMSFVNIWMILWSITIMTFSFSPRHMANHEHHVCLVLEKFQEVGLYANLEKCGFHQSEVEFLSYIFSRNGICMDPRKVQTIVD